MLTRRSVQFNQKLDIHSLKLVRSGIECSRFKQAYRRRKRRIFRPTSR